MTGVALIASIMVIGAVPFIMVVKRRKRVEPKFVSPPPLPPCITPTVTVNSIVIGPDSYADIYDGEETVSVISVDGDKVTFVDKQCRNMVLPNYLFTTRYTSRTPTSLSNQ